MANGNVMTMALDTMGEVFPMQVWSLVICAFFCFKLNSSISLLVVQLIVRCFFLPQACFFTDFAAIQDNGISLILSLEKTSLSLGENSLSLGGKFLSLGGKLLSFRKST